MKKRKVTIPSGPRMVRREKWLDLPDQSTYPGFKFLFWMNHPNRLWEQVFRPQDTPEMDAALHRLVRQHNGWQDDEGQPFPPADSPEFYGAIPDELASQILVAMVVWSRGPLPNSPSGTKGKSESGSKPATKEESPSPGPTPEGE